MIHKELGLFKGSILIRKCVNLLFRLLLIYRTHIVSKVESSVKAPRHILLDALRVRALLELTDHLGQSSQRELSWL